jgi:hypothetical protein
MYECQLRVSQKMIETKLPQWLLDMIASVPSAGSGVHLWLYKVARQLHAHRHEEDIVRLLMSACQGCGRPVPVHEIRDAVVNSRNTAWQPLGSSGSVQGESKPAWPAVNPDARRKAICGAGIEGVADLWAASPTVCTSDSLDAEFFIDRLFPNDPLLCIGRTNAEFATAPREDFRGRLSKMSLIVPSSMSALTGKRKKDDKVSAHTLENTGPRHYLVTEFDQGAGDEQAALIWHLKQFAPLTVIIWSGGKSLHAWWKCCGVDEAKVRAFMHYAVILGADPATWTRSQFVRLPQGWRADKKALQEVVYFDHTRVEGPTT